MSCWFRPNNDEFSLLMTWGWGLCFLMSTSSMDELSSIRLGLFLTRWVINTFSGDLRRFSGLSCFGLIFWYFIFRMAPCSSLLFFLSQLFSEVLSSYWMEIYLWRLPNWPGRGLPPSLSTSINPWFLKSKALTPSKFGNLKSPTLAYGPSAINDNTFFLLTD